MRKKLKDGIGTFASRPPGIVTFASANRALNEYWHVRNLRGAKWGQAARRRHYRKIAVHKKRLQLAGVNKREILDLLACCRLQCSGKKQPFEPCRYCA
jgi:hypothetical protein